MFFRVMFRRVVCMLFSMGKVRMGNVRMMRRSEVIAGFMMLCGFRVVVCRQSVMMSGLLVMLCCLLRHGEISSRSQTSGQASASMLQIFISAQYPLGYGAFK
jgi:hypothetical protein